MIGTKLSCWSCKEYRATDNGFTDKCNIDCGQFPFSQHCEQFEYEPGSDEQEFTRGITKGDKDLEVF